MIYLDNSATSFPKPPCVIEAIGDYLKHTGASSGRSGHKPALKAARMVFSCREKLAGLFNIKDSSRVVFTSGATESLNTAISGLMEEGDEVVTTTMEHNSVMRPLRYLEKTKSIRIKFLNMNELGAIKKGEIKEKITEKTKLIIVNHVSNITGSIVPLEYFRDIKKNALLLVDAAQSAGIHPMDVEKYGIDLLAFTGHKGLLGVTGTGGLYVRENIRIKPLKFGGTGSLSEKEEQPDFFPDKMESGTLNTTGIAGLNASLDFILNKGIENIMSHERKLSEYFMEKINSIDEIILYGPREAEKKLAVFSINIKDRDPAETGFILDRKYDIYVRAGLHCSPSAHKTTGTYPKGTIRISFGYFNSFDDIDFLVTSLKEIIKT
jgi:cysteine desulfurase family protein